LSEELAAFAAMRPHRNGVLGVFIPWAPVATGRLSKSGSIDDIAKAHGATPSQVALAWLLKRSPVMLPIPGTSKVAHLEENIAAVEIHLSEKEFATLNR
jgi:pyridoxine 4-dehydrogenase